MMDSFDILFHKAKKASREIAAISDEQRSEAILKLADILDISHQEVLSANKKDLEKMSIENPLYDRLQLTDTRLNSIADDLRNVAALPCPVGEIIEQRMLPNGIDLKRIRVPFGVIGIIYEARPNVTFDVFALCLKSGNSCVLKGGKDAEESNQAIINLIHRALSESGIPTDCCILLPSSHEATEAMLKAVGYVDVCIPRGGKNLINFVRNNAKVPVIETGAGVVHAYFDSEGDLEIGKRVIHNAKTRRVSVCNALDSLLIHKDRLDQLYSLIAPLERNYVELYADKRAFEKLNGYYPSQLLHLADDEMKDMEWMDKKLGIFTVDSLDDAINHITEHGSGHSESIITENSDNAQRFLNLVDASSLYLNLPTSFTDGGQFGLGAEIGISTQKLGPRGPMGLTEMTTYKYILKGRGQTRP